MSLLQIDSISKSYSGKPVLKDVSFEAGQDEIICLLGPSGCGKTTLLRIIAGLESADSGSVFFEGRSIDAVPVHNRGFGMMFQDYALFPHRNVTDNVAFGMRMQSLPRSQFQERTAEMLALVGLEGYGPRKVYDLSGGEQQRVALARSLAPAPRLLMLDEPLGSLDRTLREELMIDLQAILKQVGVTTIYVTHDQEEAFALGDHVIILRGGIVVQQGAPQSIYRRPASPWVARFLGLSNLIQGRVLAADPLEVDTLLGVLPVGDVAEQPSVGQEVTLLVRPEASCQPGFSLREGEPTAISGTPVAAGAVRPTADHEHRFEVTVTGCSFRGGYIRLTTRHASGAVLALDISSHTEGVPKAGDTIPLTLRSRSTSLLAGAHGESQPTG